MSGRGWRRSGRIVQESFVDRVHRDRLLDVLLLDPHALLEQHPLLELLVRAPMVVALGLCIVHENVAVGLLACDLDRGWLDFGARAFRDDHALHGIDPRGVALCVRPRGIRHALINRPDCDEKAFC